MRLIKIEVRFASKCMTVHAPDVVLSRVTAEHQSLLLPLSALGLQRVPAINIGSHQHHVSLQK
jgi:hypothetical protein